MPIPKPRYYISAYAIAVREGFKGSVTEWLASLKGEKGYGIPPGGTAGQILKKKSNSDYDFEWGETIDPDAAVPPGGTAGQVLQKESDTDYDASWKAIVIPGGTVTSVDGISPVNGDVSITIIGQTDPTTATPGNIKQKYFNETAKKLFICTAAAEGAYTWTEVGAAITVDAAIDADSENPVQNKVIYIELGNKQTKHKTETATVEVADWDSQDNTAMINVTGITTTNLIDVRYAPASYDDWIANGVRFVSQGNGTLTLKARTIPSTDIDVNIVIWD